MGKKIVLTGVTLTDTSAPMLQTGENLLLNGSFEASIVTGVQKYQGPEVTSQSTTGATHGTKTIQVVTSGVSGQGVSLLTDTGIGTQGATYIGAADLSGSGSATCWLRFFYTDATNENRHAAADHDPRRHGGLRQDDQCNPPLPFRSGSGNDVLCRQRQGRAGLDRLAVQRAGHGAVERLRHDLSRGHLHRPGDGAIAMNVTLEHMLCQ
jgi:hypothetical protein